LLKYQNLKERLNKKYNQTRVKKEKLEKAESVLEKAKRQAAEQS